MNLPIYEDSSEPERIVLASRLIDPVETPFSATEWKTSTLMPRFGSERWEITSLDVSPRSQRTLDFRLLTPEWSLYAREIIYWRSASPTDLRTRVGSSGTRRWAAKDLRTGTIFGFFSAVRSLATAASELQIGIPSQWDSYALDRLSDWVRVHASRSTVASVLQSLHGLGELLTLGPIPVDPFADIDPREFVGLSPKTEQLRGSPVRPHVYAPLLKSAIRYVELAAPDVIAAVRWRTDIEERWKNNPPERLPRRIGSDHPAMKAGYSRILEWKIDLLLADLGAVPTATESMTGEAPIGSVSVVTVAALLDNPLLKNNANAVSFLRSRAENGAGVSPGLLPLTVSSDEDGPWREPFCWTSINVERQALRDACVVVITAFTGMRVSEVESIPAKGWLTTWFGHPAIRAQLVKTGDGEERKWWITPLVKRACEVLEETAKPGSTYLVSSTANTTPKSESITETRIAVDIVLSRFIRRINTASSLRGFPHIPAGWAYGTERDESAPKITPHQLRFALAAIGNTAALGDAALLAQFKHSLHAMTWGYMRAGGSSEWIDTLTQRQAHESSEHTLSVMTSIWAGEEPLKGAGGRQIHHRVRESLRLTGTPSLDVESEEEAAVQFMAHVLDSPSLLALQRRLGADLYYGTLNHCLFNPQTAACGQSEQPLLAHCRPEQCANTVIPIENLPIFIDTRDELREHRSQRRLPKRAKDRLDARISDLDRQIGDS